MIDDTEQTMTATLTIDADVEQLIRSIVRDEMKKAVTEKVDGALKGILTAVAKTAVAQVPKANLPHGPVGSV